MAEPVYPNLEEEGTPRPLGFEGLVEDKPDPDQRQRVDDKRIASISKKTEEIQLIEDKAKPKRDQEEQDTVFFKDGIRRIDFCLTYKDVVVGKKKTEEEIAKSSKRRAEKRQKFLENLESKGLQFEYQEPSYYDGETWFIKVHATFECLEEGAEDLLLRMPIKEVDLPRKDKTWYRDIFTRLHVRDPFELFDPKIPSKFKYADCFTAPYIKKQRADYLGTEDELNFFSSAQRSFIVWNIMENTQYGENEDQVGVSRLLQNNSFTSAFVLHDGDFTKKDGETEIQNERQLLHYEWSHPKNFYKYQPLENIRHYFGEKIGLYFAWVGFYTSWLGIASIIGIIVMIAGLFTIALPFNPTAREICDPDLREFFYMCPRCDDTCDFWYYFTSCNFARVSLLFDYGGTVFFAAFMACWAVLFLEFWKRTESQLQYQWDTLGFEDAEQRERPEFVQAIKQKIKNFPEEQKKRYKIYNPVLERYEYIQPTHILWPKVALAVSILSTMAAAVLGIVFAVLIYRLAVSTAIYQVIQNLPGGPSAADLVVSISGSCIQLVFIIIMNQVYERVATWLTSWELHRTDTEYEDSFTYKMYIFQFINFYTSLFYIAFVKGRFTGYPGGYLRIGPFRLDECSAYGCLLELTIQLGIIFVGKQVLNDFTELGVPYAKQIIKKLLRYRKERGKEKEEDDSFVRWEKDFELIPLSIHGLFFEYLELVIQYGFVTIFVAAFPLAPFFAWVNNVIEIRLDAHKFIQVFRRPIAERAQDIGAWFHLLRFVTSLCVVTNALLIAITSQFIDRELYANVYSSDNMTGGFVNWATSEFTLQSLLTPTFPGDNVTSFPVYTALDLDLYDENNNKVMVNGQQQLYLPFIDFDCLSTNYSSNFTANSTISRNELLRLARDPKFQSLVLKNERMSDESSLIETPPGICFNSSVTCRFRGLVDQDGEFPLKYWRLWTAKLAFIIVFENVIFIIGIILDLIVPDVPKSVEDEIRREKLLSARLAAKSKKADAERERASSTARPLEEP